MNESNRDFTISKLAFDLEGTNEVAEFEYSYLGDNEFHVTQFDDDGNAYKAYKVTVEIEEL